MRNYITILCGILLTLGSCTKDVLTETPPNLITTETLYKNYAGFDAGINGVYGLVRHSAEGLAGSSSITSELFMLGTDNLVSNHDVSPFNRMTVSWRNENNSTNEFYRNAFIWLYEIVNSCNAIIVQADNEDVDWTGGSGSEEENKMYIISNAKAARAWAYRHLTYLWGDVPLNLQESKGSNIVTNWKRENANTVRRQMITDWRSALEHIPVEPFPGRISKGAVQHYLAEMYLLNNNLDSAIYFANEVIDNPAYKLVTSRYGVNKDKPGVPFMDMFLTGNTNREEGNTEALWVFQFERQTVGGGDNNIIKRHHISRYNSIRVGNVSPFQFTVERGGRGLGRISLTKWAIDLYEDGDDRASEHAIRKFFILRNAAENAPAPADRLPAGYAYGDTIWLDWTEDISETNTEIVNWPYSRKVEYVDPEDISGNLGFKDQIHLRVAETYFLKAEALFRKNRLDEAAEVINIIRKRANASPISPSDVTLDFILDERSRELILEEDRRYTLLRTGTWLTRTKLHNKNGGQYIAERDTLFPIPQVVIDANLTEKMDQNYGY